jgi:transcriptional regulator with XRE-family HTH domain
MDENFIQERIAQLRIKKGVSARDMSLSLGQSESYINTIENKKSLPSMTVFLYICEYFEITPMEFFDEGNSDPEKLKELIKDLKQLDEKSLSNIAGLAKELADKK